MSCKYASGFFENTNGRAIERLTQILGYIPDEPTATVWEHIEATAENYPGIDIPQSFVVDTPYGKFWTHGNATDHMRDAVYSLKGDFMLAQTNPSLYSQFILYDYRKALIELVRGGFKLGRVYSIGHWDFKIAKSRESDKYPVVVHAIFTGLT